MLKYPKIFERRVEIMLESEKGARIIAEVYAVHEFGVPFRNITVTRILRVTKSHGEKSDLIPPDSYSIEMNVVSVDGTLEKHQMCVSVDGEKVEVVY